MLEGQCRAAADLDTETLGGFTDVIDRGHGRTILDRERMFSDTSAELGEGQAHQDANPCVFALPYNTATRPDLRCIRAADLCSFGLWTSPIQGGENLKLRKPRF